MSSIRYIERIVKELGDLIRDSWTGSREFEKTNDEYQSLRRRLYALEPIIGRPPAFLESADSLWDLWNALVKNKLPTYDTRRDFLEEHYAKHYKALINKLDTGITFEQEMMYRDLAVIEEIGEGGFGVVYAAEHIVLGDKRAIKKLEPIFANDKDEEKALRRFAREARMLDKLAHPNIVRFFDAGMAGKYPFIVMEYVDGDNLKKVISDEGPLPSRAAFKIIYQIVGAVARAHTLGIVHRDIKPTNLMWNGERAVILDYGAGQWLERQLSTRMTTTVIGTSGYIANELLEDPKLVAPSLDCFSLGVVFHYLLTGCIPNTGDPTYYLNERAVEKNIQRVIIQALAPAEKRFADGLKFLSALEAVIS